MREETGPQNKHKTIEKMAIVTYILIITLNIKGINAPIKRHQLAEWKHNLKRRDT